MKTISLADFQQHCLSILEQIEQTHQSVFISKQGKLIVQVIPLFPPEHGDWLGCMADAGKIAGDILAPTQNIRT